MVIKNKLSLILGCIQIKCTLGETWIGMSIEQVLNRNSWKRW